MDSVATAHSFDGNFVLGSLGIVLINIVLSGDNSVAIAMAVHSLPPGQRAKGIFVGTAGAVVMRVGLTWFATRLLNVPFLKFGGGALILWIAVKLLLEEVDEESQSQKPVRLWHAVWIILVADCTMSLDNVLAVAGVSHGDMLQIWMSLGLSIPLVIFASAVLSKLMARYPAILYLGAALLGKVGGEMMITDHAALRWPGLADVWVVRLWEGLCTFGVLAFAYALKRSRMDKAGPADP